VLKGTSAGLETRTTAGLEAGATVLCYTPPMRALALVMAATFIAGSSSSGQAPTKPDLIFLNGVIYTGQGFADDKPQTVQAIAIGSGKILAVGSDAEIRRLAGPGTHIRDLNTAKTGAYLFPGFDDAHVHLGMAASMKMNLDLSSAHSLAAMMAEIASFARTLPPGHWITGGQWDQTLWTNKALPTREELDRVTAGRPAFLSRVDGHIAIANTAALKAAGINGKTVPPEGGAIDRDAHGNPTGIVCESAQQLIEKIIPPPTPAERRRGIELVIANALANGVTSAQDFSDWQDFLVYEELEKEGKLNLRISEWIPFREPLALEEQQRAQHPASDPMLHTTMLKGFMDGSLGSRTAALKQPYSDDPGNTGLPQYTQAELNQMAVERADAGFQLGFHAIGDRAVSMALDTIAQPGISTTARNRIEHAQVVDPADIPRFRGLGVIASMQPCHLLTDINWAEARLGPQRARYSYAWKQFLDAGVRVAFGTDYPVEPISPYRGLYAAVTRMNEAGTKSYFPQDAITRGQALAAYTQGAAYAEFAEHSKELLLPGYDADFILVDRDLYTVPAPALLHAQTLETYVAGRQVFLANVHLQ
jgi:predicted amidohydrolase YtcJ